MNKNKVLMYSAGLASVVAIGALAPRGISAGSCCSVAAPIHATAAAATAAQPLAVGAAQSQIDATVKSYLAVQQLLAQDKLDGVGTELAKIRDSAKGLVAADDAKIKEQGAAIAKSAAGEPKTIKDARDAFKTLSADVIGLVHIAPQTADAAAALYEASCPMAKASWLQTSKDIANPYFGKSMSDCGKIERKIEPASGAHGAHGAHQH